MLNQPIESLGANALLGLAKEAFHRMLVLSDLVTKLVLLSCLAHNAVRNLACEASESLVRKIAFVTLEREGFGRWYSTSLFVGKLLG